MFNIFFSRLILLVLWSVSLSAGINGVVYQDLPVRNTIDGLKLNTYGVKDPNELGVSGITVTAYLNDNSIPTTVLTDENGSWSFSTTQNARIEFSNIPTYLKTSPSVGESSTSVQFIKNGDSDVTFGLHNPKDYTDTVNPLYVNNLQQNGTHVGSNLQSLHFVNYASEGLNNNYHTFDNSEGTGPEPISTITVDKIGSVWGKAYQKTKKRLFVSSMLQRHVAYAEDKDSASIYVIDYSNNNTNDNKVKDFSLQGKNGIDLGTIERDLIKAPLNPHPLSADPLEPNTDRDAYANVGKMSYGGIDIDYNSNTLWLINLHQKAIISHDISLDNVKDGSTKQYLMLGKANLPNCTNGELRPWALKIHEGKGYVGAICDASEQNNTKDLSAHVFSFDINNPQNGFNKELSFDLNYTRQLEGWHPWQDTFVNTAQRHKNLAVFDQPILSDIEFDKNNNMYLAFIDRYAIQLGNVNYTVQYDRINEKAYSFGEILKVCKGKDKYEVEGTGSCKKANHTDRWDSNITEFFDDHAGSTLESSLGSLAILKGSEQLLNTSVNPHPEVDGKGQHLPQKYWNTQGVQTYSLSDGSIQNWYAHAMTAGKGLNGKANGLGDIELITTAAPIEIGNKIWLDANANGIQDANEIGIPGVVINLVCSNGTKIYQATTNSTGNYIFSNDSLTTNGTPPISHYYGIPELIENTDNCFLSIPNITGTGQQSTLKNLTLTSSNLGQGTNSTLRDSNASIDGVNAIVTINASDIPIAGHNNHSFDIGFKDPRVTPTTPVVTPTIPVVTPTTPIVTPTTPVVLGTTVCQEMIANDDIQPANELNAITTIDVLSNDSGSKAGQEIKFLSLTEGRSLWENSEQNISSANLLDTLTVENEGTWTVLNNEVVFTALTSFDGQIPTPVYYIVQGSDCTAATQLSNVARITINTHCTCPTYSSKSVSTLNIYSIFLLLFLTLGISLTLFKDELR